MPSLNLEEKARNLLRNTLTVFTDVVYMLSALADIRLEAFCPGVIGGRPTAKIKRPADKLLVLDYMHSLWRGLQAVFCPRDDTSGTTPVSFRLRLRSLDRRAVRSDKQRARR